MIDPSFETLMCLGPRGSGVREQFARANWFLQLGNSCPDVRGRFRIHIAGIYAARATTELMLESAWDQELQPFRNDDPKKSRKAFEDAHLMSLPHYQLIEKVRIHDFHRLGCVPPDPRFRMQVFGGPVKLTARQGVALVQVTDEGPQVATTGQSAYKEQRALLQEDDRFFDEKSGEFLSLAEILEPYLQGVPPVITQFEELLHPGIHSAFQQ